MKFTIEDVESRLEEALSKLRSPEYRSLEPLLQYVVPKDYRPRVSLFDFDKERKKRRNASADTWSPESGEIRIHFEPDKPSSSTTSRTPSTLAPGESAVRESKPAPDPLSDLVR